MLIGLELISACAPTVAIPGGKCGQESSPQCQYQTGAGIGQAGMGHAGIGQGGEQVTVTTAAGDTRPEQRKTLLWCSMERRAGQPIGEPSIRYWVSRRMKSKLLARRADMPLKKRKPMVCLERLL